MICPDCGGRKYRRNAEFPIRKSEREYAGGNFEAGVRLLQLRMRSGLIPIDYVRRAAALGDRRSEVLAHGREPWPVDDSGYTNSYFESLLSGLIADLVVSFAADVAERVLPVFERRYPDDSRPREAIEAARRWVEDPSDANSGVALACYDDAIFALGVSAAVGGIDRPPPLAAAAAAAAAKTAAAFSGPGGALRPRTAFERLEVSLGTWPHRDRIGARYAASSACSACSARARGTSERFPILLPYSSYTADQEQELAWQKQRLIQYLLGEDDPSGFQP